jgi:hypothetical protein
VAVRLTVLGRGIVPLDLLAFGPVGTHVHLAAAHAFGMRAAAELEWAGTAEWCPESKVETRSILERIGSGRIRRMPGWRSSSTSSPSREPKSE